MDDRAAEGRKRLGAAVKADRAKKYRTVDAARIAAQISRGAWDHVEKGDPVKVFTLGAVEAALGWPAGRAQAIIDGTELTDAEAAILAGNFSEESKAAMLRIIAEDREQQATKRGESA